MARLRVAAAVAAVGVAALGALWLGFRMPGPRHAGPLPPTTPEQAALAESLRQHVDMLAGSLRARDLREHPDRLQAAAEYVEGILVAAGYHPEADEFLVAGQPVHNVVVRLEGTDHPDEIVVIGAHYDSEPGTPGADDDASGVAALLELARAMAGQPYPRTVELVAFVNEEAPYFGTPAQGAMVRATRLATQGADVVGMLSLESLGYYDPRPGSQHYPAPFSLLYPDTGDFVGFVGNLGSRSLVRQAVGTFRRAVEFPCEGAVLPEGVPGASWSDHAAFWDQGWPAVMVTGTAPFRNPNYHEPTDTPDTLDYDRMARVVQGLQAVIDELAS